MFSDLKKKLFKKILIRPKIDPSDFEVRLKSGFDDAIQTNEKGIFLNIYKPILPVYYEMLGPQPYTHSNSLAAERFLDWFKNIVFHASEEKCDLRFIGNNIKIGAILVGKDLTWTTYGVKAYSKRVNCYLSKGFNYICVMGRGATGMERTNEVRDSILAETGCEQVNSDFRFECISPDGNNYDTYCFTFKFDQKVLSDFVWEKIGVAYDKSEKISAFVENIYKEYLKVNVSGLIFNIYKENASDLALFDLRNLFIIEQEIILNILEYNGIDRTVLLSTIGTPSDPKIFIDKIISEKKLYECRVESIKVGKTGIQNGLMVTAKEFRTWIFIPKTLASNKKSCDLTQLYSPDQEVTVSIIGYKPSYNSFIGACQNLPESADSPDNIMTDKGNDLMIDNERKRDIISAKKLFKRTIPRTGENYPGEIIKAQVTGVLDKKGVKIILSNNAFKGFIPWYEIAWGPIGKMANIFKKGDIIYPLMVDDNSFRDKILFSLKRKYIHQFDQWINVFQTKDPVVGKIICHFENSVQVELIYQDLCVQAYVLMKNISGIIQVICLDSPYYLPVGESFHFMVSLIDENLKTIELTRREYLQSFEEPQFGETFNVIAAKKAFGKLYFYSDDIEGWIKEPDIPVKLGTKLTVIPVSLSSGEFVIV